MVQLLLQLGFDVNVRSASGWTLLEEAQSAGDAECVRAVFCAVQLAEERYWRRHVDAFTDALRMVPDFMLVLEWHVGYSMLGLGLSSMLRRFLPSDTYRIWKRATCLRVDVGLVGIDEDQLSWKRGRVSLLVQGQDVFLVSHDHG